MFTLFTENIHFSVVVGVVFIVVDVVVEEFFYTDSVILGFPQHPLSTSSKVPPSFHTHYTVLMHQALN